MGLVAALAGCGQGPCVATRAVDVRPRAPLSEAAGAAQLWSGSYRGRDSLRLTFAEGLETRGDDDRALLQVREIRRAVLELSIIDTRKGSPVCVLQARARAGRATIEPSQSCFELGHVAAIVHDGTATLDGPVLTVSLRGVVEVGMADGVLAYGFEGRRE